MMVRIDSSLNTSLPGHVRTTSWMFEIVKNRINSELSLKAERNFRLRTEFNVIKLFQVTLTQNNFTRSTTGPDPGKIFQSSYSIIRHFMGFKVTSTDLL